MIGMCTDTNKQENEVVTRTTYDSHNSSVSEEMTYYLYQRVRHLESLIIQGEVLMYLIIIERKRNNFLSSDYQIFERYILSLIVLHIIHGYDCNL